MVFQGGRPSGECFIEFKYAQGLESALARNRQMMGTRYIEIFRSSKMEMETRVAGGMGGGGMGGGGGYGQQQQMAVGYGGYPQGFQAGGYGQY